MSKGSSPRFTKRVRKDILGIKARSQKSQNLLKIQREKRIMMEAHLLFQLECFLKELH